MRDPRWTDVSASIMDEVVELESGFEFSCKVFRIVVDLGGGRVYWARLLVHENDLALFPQLYQLTLDEMVRGIDQRMEEDDV